MLANVTCKCQNQSGLNADLNLKFLTIVQYYLLTMCYKFTTLQNYQEKFESTMRHNDILNKIKEKTGIKTL